MYAHMNVVTIENGETTLRFGLNPGRSRKVFVAAAAPKSWLFMHSKAATYAGPGGQGCK